MFLELTMIALSVSASLGAGVPALAVWQMYRCNPMVKRIRAGHKNLKEVRACAGRCQQELQRAVLDLRRYSKLFVDSQRVTRLEAIPLERLKEMGATKVRWAALHQENYHTLASVLQTDERQLMSLPGVGPATACRVISAARKMEAKIREDPPSVPSADLAEPHAKRLAFCALQLLRARESVGGVAEELNTKVEAAEKGYDEVRAKSGLANWLFRKGAFTKGTDLGAQALGFLEETRDLIESDLVRSTLGRLEFLRERSTQHPPFDWLHEEFRERYADAAAVIEEVLWGDGQAGAQMARRLWTGGVPGEIAERAEAMVLQTTGLQVTLRQYQVFGAKYLVAQERTLLGDEMGLGKTIQALAVMVHLNGNDGSNHFLVVAPATLTRNWIGEIEARTSLPAFLVHGPERERQLSAWMKNGGVAVTSYDTLRALPKFATQVPIRFLVADEAHYLKNPQAQRTRHVAQLIEVSSYVCLMSGTPMENRPEEFVHLLGMVQPDLVQQLSDGIESGEVVGPARFRHAVANAYLRRNQKDVLRELPEKIEVPEWVEMPPADAAAYREAVFARNFSAMRRVAILGGSGGLSSKIRRLKELLDSHRLDGRKVLVFSFYLDVVRTVSEMAGSLGVITGSVPMRKRVALVDAFQKSREPEVLVCQITAGGMGLNLQAASAVVLMEPQWKPSTEVQAIARAHRMGQTRSVLVHRLLTRASVEERMLEVLAHKTRLFDAYARESTVKSASAEATEIHLANQVIAAEIARLNGNESA